MAGFGPVDIIGSLAPLPQLAEGALWHRGCVNTAAWNRDGSLLVTGSDDRRAKVWSAHRNFAQQCSIRTGHRRNIFHAGFVGEAGDRQVVTCAADGQLRLCHLARPEQPGELLCESERMMFMFEFWPDLPVLLDLPELLDLPICCVVLSVDIRKSGSNLKYQ